MTDDKFGFRAAKDSTPREAPGPDDLSDFTPAEAHSPDPQMEAEADRRAADLGFSPRSAPDDTPPENHSRSGHRRRPPKEPATQLTLHIPQRVATRFAKYTDDNNFRSYWSALEDLMDKAGVPN